MLDRIFTESENLIHNIWRDAHFNFADFYRKVLQVFLVDSNRFIFLKKFLEAGLTGSIHIFLYAALFPVFG